jgi:hypothetical protein
VAGHRIFTTSFASVYPHYVAKAERKGHSKAEVDRVISWLTGYDEAELWGSGMVHEYLDFVLLAVGSRVLGDLLSAWADVEALASDGGPRDALLHEATGEIEFRYLPDSEDRCGNGTTADPNFAVGGHVTIGLQGAQTVGPIEQAACTTAGGVGPAVFGTCTPGSPSSNPDLCTANKGYLFVPKSAGCP